MEAVGSPAAGPEPRVDDSSVSRTRPRRTGRATAGSTVTLSGSATGPWGNNVASSWKQVTDVTGATDTPSADALMLTGATTATPSFTMPGTVRFGVAHPEQPHAQRGRHPQHRERRGRGARPQRRRGHRRPDAARRGREPGPTARFSALPERHDGESAFDIELHFSAAPEGLSYKTVGGGLLAVTGATVEKARRKTRHSNIAWVVTIRPSGPGDIAIRLPARACGEANAVCFDNRPLAEDATAAVPGVPFTASFAGAPAEHDGERAFTVNFHLSLAPATLSSYATVRDSLFHVTGARIVKARRLTPRKNQNWELTVAPGGVADVTLRLKATTSCSGLPGVCDAAGRMLAGGLSTTVRGPVTLSVADAQGEEGTGQTSGFAVSLSRAASGAVTVDYATADGTATAGEDYSSTSGTLTFAAGETAKTVSVPVLDDVIDEGEETFTLRLSNATGARIADAEATGTVSNGDPLQKMWLSRFGRTVADHVVDAVAGRLSAPRAGAQITLAGQSIESLADRR